MSVEDYSDLKRSYDEARESELRRLDEAGDPEADMRHAEFCAKTEVGMRAVLNAFRELDHPTDLTLDIIIAYKQGNDSEVQRLIIESTQQPID